MEPSSKIDISIVQHFVLNASDDREYSKQDIIDTINYLIEKDMEKLLFILYRIDVAEEKIRTSLANAVNQNAAEIIYQHIYERELEKAISRAKFSQGGDFLDL